MTSKTKALHVASASYALNLDQTNNRVEWLCSAVKAWDCEQASELAQWLNELQEFANSKSGLAELSAFIDAPPFVPSHPDFDDFNDIQQRYTENDEKIDIWGVDKSGMAVVWSLWETPQFGITPFAQLQAEFGEVSDEA